MKRERIIKLMDEHTALGKRVDEAWAIAQAAPTQELAEALGETAKGLQAQWYHGIDKIVALANKL